MSSGVWGEGVTQYFYSLHPDTVLRAVERFGVRCTGRILPLNSMENRVYEVEIEAGETKVPADRFRVVKFYRPGRWSAEQIMEEHSFLGDLGELEIPVVAPSVSAGGETLLRCEETGILFTVFPKMGGRIRDELTVEDLARIGRLLGRMHAVGKSKTFKHRLVLSPQVYGEANLRYLEGSDSIPSSYRTRYLDSANRCLELITPLFANRRTQRLHGDCHLGNLLWRDDDPYWVDFDDCVTGPAMQDLWLLAPERGVENSSKLDALISGYEQMNSFDRTELSLVEPLRTLRLIHFTAWISKRWSDPAFPRSFPAFGGDRYWQEEIAGLEEQHNLLRNIAGASGI